MGKSLAFLRGFRRHGKTHLTRYFGTIRGSHGRVESVRLPPFERESLAFSRILLPKASQLGRGSKGGRWEPPNGEKLSWGGSGRAAMRENHARGARRRRAGNGALTGGSGGGFGGRVSSRRMKASKSAAFWSAASFGKWGKAAANCLTAASIALVNGKRESAGRLASSSSIWRCSVCRIRLRLTTSKAKTAEAAEGSDLSPLPASTRSNTSEK